MLDERLEEISPWVQAELYESLGRLYVRAGVSPDRHGRMVEAYERLTAAAATDDTVARRIERLDRVYREVTSQ